MSRLACNETLMALADQLGTPSYVYDLAEIDRKVAEFRQAIAVPTLVILFATMANPTIEILRHLASIGVGACVNSLSHLRLAIAAGIPPANIQFTASGLSTDQMDALIDLKVGVNLDSLGQLRLWIDRGGRCAGLRINAGSLVDKPGDRLGLDVHELMDALDLARLAGCRIEGAHVYVGTNFQGPDAMFPTLRAFFQIATSIPDLTYVNVGGGIGVDYRRSGSGFDLGAYGAELKQLHKSLGRDLTLFFEPGRAMAASCGVFLSKVTDIKRLGGRTFVAVDGSVAQFPRPFHQPDSPHSVRPLSATTTEQMEMVVVGRTTFSRDILAECSLPTSVKVGTILAFEDAGAYCSSMASRFLGQPEPAVHFLPAG